MQRTELHFHILPRVDDGPSDLDEAVEMGRLAVADGTGLVTATPHVRDLLTAGILEELPARVREVEEALRDAGIPLEVRPGAELAHDDVPLLGDHELEAIAQGPPGRRWVLLEAPLFDPDLDGFLAAAAEVRARGFGTLIGHPERCDVFMEADGAVEAERRAGARLQVNASSLTGRHGRAARRWGRELLGAGRADVIASDAHRPSRPPMLSAALEALGEAGAERFVDATPRALVTDGIAPARRVRAA